MTPRARARARAKGPGTRSSRRALSAVFVALAIALAHLVGLGHWALIRHHTCEHGLTSHAPTESEGAESPRSARVQPIDDDSAPRASQSERDEHTHCDVPALEPADVALCPALYGPLVACAGADEVRAPAPGHAVVELLLLAPKGSPPA